MDNQLNEAADPYWYISLLVFKVQVKTQYFVIFLIAEYQPSWLLLGAGDLGFMVVRVPEIRIKKNNMFPKTITWWLTTTFVLDTEDCFLVKSNATELQLISSILSNCMDRYRRCKVTVPISKEQ